MKDVAVQRPHVLITAREGEWAGLLRLPAMFRRAGVDTSVLSPRECTVRRSIYLKHRYLAPADPAGLAAALRDHLKTHRYDWIILGDEPTLLAVANENAAASTDWRDGWFPVPDRATGIPLITSKAVFTATAPQYDIPVPQSRICHSMAEVQQAVDDLHFPLMFKCARGFASNGVAKVMNAADMRNAYAQFEQRLPLVVQQFVTGRLGSTQMLFDHGKPVCWVPAYKPVCFPEPFGTSCVREMLDQAGIDAMKPIVENVGRMTQFHGLCGMDWIQQDDGSFRVLEFNPRPTTVMHLGPLSGVDCADAIRAMLRGGENIQRPRQVSQAQVYMFPQYLKRAMRLRRWGDVLRYVPFRSHHDIPWDEPGFLATHLWSLLNLAVRHGKVSIKETFIRKPKPAPKPTAADAMSPEVAEEVAL